MVVEERPEVVMVTYTRGIWHRNRLHIDPVIRWNFIAYGLGSSQMERSPIKRIPQGVILIPIRYNSKYKAYVAPAIGRVLLTLGGEDLPADVMFDAKITNFINDPEGVLLESVPSEEDQKISEEDQTLVLEALNTAGAITRDHIFENRGLVVIARTLICFSEDEGLEPVDAPSIDMELAAYLLNYVFTSYRKYVHDMGRPNIKYFTNEKALELVRRLIQQRIPWLK